MFRTNYTIASHVHSQKQERGCHFCAQVKAWVHLLRIEVICQETMSTLHQVGPLSDSCKTWHSNCIAWQNHFMGSCQLWNRFTSTSGIEPVPFAQCLQLSLFDKILVSSDLKVLKKHAGMRHSGGVSIDRHMEHLKLRTLILHRAPKFRIKWKNKKKLGGQLRRTQKKLRENSRIDQDSKGVFPSVFGLLFFGVFSEFWINSLDHSLCGSKFSQV